MAIRKKKTVVDKIKKESSKTKSARKTTKKAGTAVKKANDKFSKQLKSYDAKKYNNRLNVKGDSNDLGHNSTLFKDSEKGHVVAIKGKVNYKPTQNKKMTTTSGESRGLVVGSKKILISSKDSGVARRRKKK